MNARRIAVIAGVAVLLAAGWAWLGSPREKDDLSIVLIVVDSLRADHVGAYGYSRPTTPVIDRLAAGGIVFDHAISQAPWTKPSVASLFTSTYTSVHSVLFSKAIVGGEETTDILNDKFLTLAEALGSGAYATGAYGVKIHLRPPNGFDQGFEAFNMASRRAPKINQKALRWLRRGDFNRFFLYLHYNDVHYPYEPAPEYARFGAKTARVNINGDTKRAFYDGNLVLTSQDMQDLIDLYDGEILYTDEHIGGLIEGIEALGYSNVLVIVTADHGEEFLDHGEIAHGQSLYDELLRVPLVLGGSGLDSLLEGRTGQRVGEPVELVDMMPTLLDIAELPAPPGMQGRSLMPLLTGDPGAPAAESRPVFSERIGVDEEAFSNTVIDGRWKLIENPNDGSVQLFDLESDPLEKNPLDPASTGIDGRLAARIEEWSARNRELHAKLKPRSSAPLDEETEEQLRSLGYVN